MRRIGRTKRIDVGHAWPRRGLLAGVLAGALGLLAVVAVPGVPSASAQAPVGQGFNLNPSDLRFILKQIKIAENHAATTTPATGPCGALLGHAPDQIPDDGTSASRSRGACAPSTAAATTCWTMPTAWTRRSSVRPTRSSRVTSQHSSRPRLRHHDARPVRPSWTPSRGVISNLIVDQTPTNPAAVAVAGADDDLVNGSYFIPNVATDVGLSAPYNSWFTLFGQFFDHGLDLVNKGGAGTVFVPLDASDPLVPGPDGIAGTGDDVPPQLRFMVLTRASHVNGEATNQTTPFVDQSQTYTSHPSHQVFLRDYDLVAGRPEQTGHLITGSAASPTEWPIGPRSRRRHAPCSASNSPTRTSRTSRWLQPTSTATSSPTRPRASPSSSRRRHHPRVRNARRHPITTAGTTKTGHAFLDDIAHHAAPAVSQPRSADPVHRRRSPAR